MPHNSTRFLNRLLRLNLERSNDRMQKPKNPAAVALGRMGGRKRSEAQKAHWAKAKEWGGRKRAETKHCHQCERTQPLAAFPVRYASGKQVDDKGARIRVRASQCGQCWAGHQQISRHLKRGDANPAFPFIEWGRKVEQAQGRCTLCGIEARLVIDHIQAFADGGSLCIDNLRAVCQACNHPHSQRRVPAYRADGL